VLTPLLLNVGNCRTHEEMDKQSDSKVYIPKILQKEVNSAHKVDMLSTEARS
jgi:hypothetical protein